MSAAHQADVVQTAIGYLTMALRSARHQASVLSRSGNNAKALAILADIDGIDLEFRTARRLSPNTILPKLEELTLRAQNIGNDAILARSLPIALRPEQVVSLPEPLKVQRWWDAHTDGKWWPCDKPLMLPVNPFQGVQTCN